MMRGATKKKKSEPSSRSQKAAALEVLRHHPMLIEWSDEDQVFVAGFPTLHSSKTHGKTTGEAAEQGMDLLETLLMPPSIPVPKRTRK